MTASLRAILRGRDQLPGTVRALGRAANVPHSTLIRIATGELGATREVAERIAVALEAWSQSCATNAANLRRSLRRAPSTRK